MSEIEKWSEKAMRDAYTNPEDSFAERNAYRKGHKEGWRKCRDLIVQDLLSFALQTDDNRFVHLANHFETFGELRPEPRDSKNES